MSREELVSRFQTEARAAGLLTHHNIVVIFDAGEEEGLFYITMEIVEGRSLQTLLDARQLFPLPRVMKLMEQVCSALDFAQQRPEQREAPLVVSGLPELLRARLDVLDRFTRRPTADRGGGDQEDQGQGSRIPC